MPPKDSEDEILKQGRALFQGLVVTNWFETFFTALFYFFPGIEAVSKCLIVNMNSL